MEHQFHLGLRGFAGFATDISGASPGTQGNSTVSFWDIFHVSTGATMTFGRTDVTLGAIGAFGGATTKRGFSLVPSQDDLNIPAGKDVDYFRLTFILGFNFDFK